MADTVGDIVTRIRKWTIDDAVDNDELWALMDEVIDEVMAVSDPWFCFDYGQVARSASNHFNDSGLIPPAYEDGTLAVSADIASGTTVPDNSEYLRAFLFPAGLKKAIKVFYGQIQDDVELEYVPWEEFNLRYPPTTDGGNTPSYWTRYGKTLLIGPHPPLEATLSIYGVYRPTEITSNADTNIFVTDVDRLLRYGVMNKLILYNYEEDAGRGMFIERVYRKLFNEIKLEGKYKDHRVQRATSRRAGTRRT